MPPGSLCGPHLRHRRVNCGCFPLPTLPARARFISLKFLSVNFGCTRPLLQHVGYSCWGARAGEHPGSIVGGVQRKLLPSVWDYSSPTTSPSLEGAFLTAGPPGKSLPQILLSKWHGSGCDFLLTKAKALNVNYAAHSRSVRCASFIPSYST